MIIKPDLEKAYDRMQWSYIHDTLHDRGLPPQLIQTIMNYISSGNCKLLWSGEDPFYSFLFVLCMEHEGFKTTRGFRQGDALYSFLFVLRMERFSHWIKSRVEASLWNSDKTSRGSPKISHLFYADDIILFEEANHSQVLLIKEALHCFLKASCQRTNLS